MGALRHSAVVLLPLLAACTAEELYPWDATGRSEGVSFESRAAAADAAEMTAEDRAFTVCAGFGALGYGALQLDDPECRRRDADDAWVCEVSWKVQC